MDWLLNDGEINKAVKGQRYYGQTQVANSWLRDRAIAKAQARKLVGWMNSHKDNRWGGTAIIHFLCTVEDWQALKEEIK